MYQTLMGKHSEDKRYDEAYDEYYDENLNDNTTGDNPSSSSEANTSQPAPCTITTVETIAVHNQETSEISQPTLLTDG